jgi:hypothetical protein
LSNLRGQAFLTVHVRGGGVNKMSGAPQNAVPPRKLEEKDG